MTREQKLEAALTKALAFVERIAATAPTTPSRHQRKMEAANVAVEIRALLSTNA